MECDEAEVDFLVGYLVEGWCAGCGGVGCGLGDE